MAVVISSGVQKRKKFGLPTYCYCNYRLLRAINLANAVPAVQTFGSSFNLEWLSKLGAEMESLTEFAKRLEGWEIEKLQGDTWQSVNRTTRIDLNPGSNIPNNLRRLLWSSKDGGNGVEGFLIYWFRCNEGWLPFEQKGNRAYLYLSDEKSPCCYRIRYVINGEEYYIMIDGIKTVQRRKRKRSGRTTQNGLSTEQAKTAVERKLGAMEIMSKKLQISQSIQAHEDVDQASHNLEY